MITIIYHLYNDKKSIIDIRFLFKSRFINFISNISNKNDTQQY